MQIDLRGKNAKPNSLSSSKWIPFNRRRDPALLIKTLQTGEELILEVFEIWYNVLGFCQHKWFQQKALKDTLIFLLLLLLIF